jgi:hypothetical protein
MRAMKVNWPSVEVQYLIDKGNDPETARTFVILRWMLHGDLRPLVAAIDEGQKLDKAVLNMLAAMIDGDTKLSPHYRLNAVPIGKGRPINAINHVQKLVSVWAYNVHTSNSKGKSKDSFKKIAAVLDLSESSVRQYITASRKQRNK